MIGSSQKTVISGLAVAEKHEVLWKIHNFEALKGKPDLLAQEKLTVLTGTGSPESKEKAKWSIHLMESKYNWETRFYVKCELDNKPAHGAPEIHILIEAEVRKSNGAVWWQGKTDYRTPKGMSDWLFYRWEVPENWRSVFLDAETGALTMFIRLSVLVPVPKLDCKILGVDGKNIRLISEDTAENNGARLMESSESDVKIKCKDGVELKAHRAILIGNSSVFEKMLTSGLSEQTSGVINVLDIGGRAMQLLVDFMYTGKLSPVWRDNYVVVEFIYAAGKYELVDVLKHVDATLELTGIPKPNQELSSAATLALLDLTTKLGLEQAAMRLKEKLMQFVDDAKSAAEMVSIFNGANYPQ